MGGGVGHDECSSGVAVSGGSLSDGFDQVAAASQHQVPETQTLSSVEADELAADAQSLGTGGSWGEKPFWVGEDVVDVMKELGWSC